MRPRMNPLYEQMKTSVFERMSLAATRNGAVNLGQGFPDFGWPDAILEAAARALKDGSNQYAPSRGLACAAGGRRGPLQPPFRTGTDGRPCLRDQRRDRGAWRGDPRDGRAWRRGDHLHARLRQLCADDPKGRGDAGRGRACNRPTGGSTQRRSEAAVRPKTRAILFNNPHNPTGKLFEPRSWKRSPRSPANTTSSSSATRFGSMSLLDGRSFTPHRDAARNGRAHDQGRVGRQDFFADRLEGRLDGRCARARDRCCARAPVPDLLDGAQSAGGGGIRAQRGRRVDRSRCGRASSGRATG